MKIKIGDKFNRLTVIDDDGTRTAGGKIKWKCRCSCGKVTYVVGHKLKTGIRKSCGCVRGEENRVQHRHYSRAESIYNRCNSKNNKFYNIYKGKNKLGDNIWDICKSLDEVPGYFEGAQIDRIDNSGDYTLRHPKHGRKVYHDSDGNPCIGNLRWVTQQDNLMNTSRNITMKSLRTEPRQKSNIKRALKRRGLDIDDYELEFVGRDSSNARLYVII